MTHKRLDAMITFIAHANCGIIEDFARRVNRAN